MGLDSGPAAGTAELVAPGGRDVVFSEDGTTVAYRSAWNGHGTPDTNGTFDVFVQDLASGDATLVSADAAGAATGNGFSLVPSLSDDGTKVSFVSSATNLGPVDTTLCTRWELPPRPLPPRQYQVNCPDVYVRDLVAGTTTLVSTRADRLHSANEESTRALFLPGTADELVFVTYASDIDPLDAQHEADIYLAHLTDADSP